MSLEATQDGAESRPIGRVFIVAREIALEAPDVVSLDAPIGRLKTVADAPRLVVLNEAGTAQELPAPLPNWIEQVENTRPTPRQSELDALEKYGGEEQLSWLDGKQVPYGTPGSTRPDIAVTDPESGVITAIEVKNYELGNNASVEKLCTVITAQVSHRVENMPPGTQQIIVIDVRGQNLTPERIEEIKAQIKAACEDLYPDIQVDTLED